MTLEFADSPGVMSREQIRFRIGSEHPLISDWIDLDAQLQPNGFDLTLREISSFAAGEPGVIGRDNADRMLPNLVPLAYDEAGWLTLEPGIYQVVYNEVVDLPNQIMAFGRPRSSLCRCGVTLHTAVWDAGYRGRSTSLLNVINPAGIRLQRDARIMQLVFIGLAQAATDGYRGVYLGENTDQTTAPGI